MGLLSIKQGQLNNSIIIKQKRRKQLPSPLLKIILIGCFVFYFTSSSYIFFKNDNKGHLQLQQQQLLSSSSSKNNNRRIIGTRKVAVGENNKLIEEKQQPHYDNQQIINKKEEDHDNNRNINININSGQQQQRIEVSVTAPAVAATAIATEIETTTSTTIAALALANKTATTNTTPKFWRYDEASPTIDYATTHLLSSIPIKHRLVFNKLSSTNTSFELKGYASHNDHVWPHKLHLFEINPSIAKFPTKYYNDRDDGEWQKLLSEEEPHYVSVYRVTHWNNCYDGTINVQLFGGSWDNARNKIPQTDYVGFSLLGEQLNIIIDTVVDLKSIASSTNYSGRRFIYNDYRLFNLRGGKSKKEKHNNGDHDDSEQLYLTTMNHIVPIELSIISSSSSSSTPPPPPPPDGYLEIPFAFAFDNDDDDNHRTHNSTQSKHKKLSLRVFIRNYSSCPVENSIKRRNGVPKKAKNLLYFDEHVDAIKNEDTNRTTINTHTHILFQPKSNPNEVMTKVDLDKPCQPHRQTTLMYEDGKEWEHISQPTEHFQTVEQQIYPTYPNDQLFMADRGSACCTHIYITNSTINSIINNMTTTNTPTTTFNKQKQQNSDDFNDDVQKIRKLNVAVVHPKTKFPGKQLPNGITPNTYLSRFIAFLPHEPYTIVAKSGMFCLGYPTTVSDDSISSKKIDNDCNKHDDLNNYNHNNNNKYNQYI